MDNSRRLCIIASVVILLISSAVVLLVCSSTSRRKAQHEHYLISVNVSDQRQIPPVFLGVFLEEINHAGAGGLWAELVQNRGFEAGGHVLPSMISPWGTVGDEDDIYIATELSSCFETNPVALRMDVHCNRTSCPAGGVGVFNPGFWGMNIEKGQSYRVVFFTKSSTTLELAVSFVSDDGAQVLDSHTVTAEANAVKNWTKIEITLQANGCCTNSRLQLTTNQEGTIWLDQVSAMPYNTYKGHGFRTDLIEMVLRLKPKFLRFPGGCYVEGRVLRNAFRWKQTIGAWERRSGHVNDFWGYWSDDGLGYLEYLQLAEDLGVEPVWVVNSGIGFEKDESVDTGLIAPFVQEILDSIEFARGSPNSRWGSLRAELGHPSPFKLNYVSIGNENCGQKDYKGNYLKFYNALKNAYPDIKIISNCDASEKPLDHPADLYDYHTYPRVPGMLQLTHHFEGMRNDPRAPKAFVSEYAVMNPKDKIKNGTFEAALAEAAFLLSLEQHSDVVEMVSYAPLFAPDHDLTWSPDAIIFNSSVAYGIASYWVQTFFQHSSGAYLLNANNQPKMPANLYMTAISWIDEHGKRHITLKFVNFNQSPSKMRISLHGVDPISLILTEKTQLTCSDLNGDNTMDSPNKVVPVSTKLQNVGNAIDLEVQQYSLTSFRMMYKQ